MPLGNVVSDLQAVNSGSYMYIKPTLGNEWVIHNIYVPDSKDVELYFTDGSHRQLVDTGDGSWLNYHWHVTSSFYLEVKNVSGSQIYIGYDGVQTKVV